MLHIQEILKSTICILEEDRPLDMGQAIEFADAFFVFRILLGRGPSEEELIELKNVSGAITAREFLARILDFPEYRYQARFLPPGHEFLSDLNGFLFRFRTDDREMGVPMALGIYEPAVTGTIRKLAGRCRTMVDVGANTGYMSCTFLAVAQSDARVIAFEPMKENVNLFRRNMEINEFCSRVTLHEAACGSEQGKIEMSEVSGMMVGCEVDGRPTSQIQVVTLDDVISEPVDLIKIDVEGAEPMALRGMRRILNESRPIIITELNDYWLREVSGSSSREYVSQIESAGFRVVTAESHFRGDDESVVLPEDDPLFVTEVVCVPQ